MATTEVEVAENIDITSGISDTQTSQPVLELTSDAFAIFRLWVISVLILLLVLGVLCFVQFCLIWSLYHKANSIDNYIVSPIESILEKFEPNSTYPCAYPYEKTYKCNCKSKHFLS